MFTICYRDFILWHNKKKLGVYATTVFWFCFVLVLVAQLCPTLCKPWTVARQASVSMEFSRQEYWSGSPVPSLGIFPTQESNPGLLHCRQILYHLSHIYMEGEWKSTLISSSSSFSFFQFYRCSGNSFGGGIYFLNFSFLSS